MLWSLALKSRFMKKYLLILVVLLFLFAGFLSGCATGKSRGVVKEKATIYASHDKEPSWITVIPEDRYYYYFVGTSSDSESYDSGKKAAINDALSQVVAVIGITVTSTLTFEERYFAEQYSREVSSELFSEGKGKLKDAEIKEVYYERHEKADGSTSFRVWVLLKYSKDEIKKEQERLDDILSLKYGEVKRLEKKASSFEERNLLLDAVIAYVNASLASLRIEDEGVFFDRYLNRVNELLMKIALRKYGDDQVGYVGKALEEPLYVKVFYIKENVEIPIPNIPVKFLSRVPKTKGHGYKIRAYSTVADSEGMAGSTIDNIYEVSDRNEVDAEIDLSSYIFSQLKSVPSELQDRVKTLKDVLKTKRVTFTYKSDTRAREINTGIFFIQLDLDDELLPKPVTAPVIFDLLYRKKFTVRVLNTNPSSVFQKSDDEILDKLTKSAGKAMKRIVFGYVRIVNYDTISGFHTARAEASAKLFDTETGEILRTWQIARSGTGSSKEGAQLNVLTEVGRSLGEILPNTMP